MRTLLRLPSVLARTGFKKSKLWVDVKAGRFPRPVRISEGMVCWLEDEIEDWIEARVRERDTNKGVCP